MRDLSLKASFVGRHLAADAELPGVQALGFGQAVGGELQGKDFQNRGEQLGGGCDGPPVG